MKTGIEIIAAERERQINAEGWSAEHDKRHSNGGLAVAAACYALPQDIISVSDPTLSLSVSRTLLWPWHPQWWKPTPNDRIRELSKAGALIAAEIDRLNSIKNDGINKKN